MVVVPVIRVAFVLVNWNTRELLIECLRGLRQARVPLQMEIIVVDNASADGSARAVAEGFPEVTLICNGANIGFARAVNQGIRGSRAPIVGLVNPDLEIDCEALDICLRVMESDPGIGALGPLLREGNGRVWEYRDRFPTALGMIGAALLPFGPPERLSAGRRIGADLYEVDWLAGACLLLRRAALERVGLLDERFFLYKEDVDLCLRLRRAGYQVVRHHGTSLRHLIAQSTRRNPGRISDRANVEGFRSSVLYAHKEMGSTVARLLAVALRLSLVPRIAKAALLGAATGCEIHRRKIDWMRTAWRELGRIAPERVDDVRRVA